MTKRRRGQVVDELAVDGGLEGEVELLEGAPVGEVGEAQPGGQATVGGGGGLGGDDPFQVTDRGQLFGHRLLGQGGEALRGRVEPQIAEVVLQLLVGDGPVMRHAPAPSRS